MRGLLLRAPKGDRVRPTQDRVREAVFSMLAAKVPGARTLDLFAGTGALGLEAASRGATHVTWVEEDRRAAEVIRKNARLLDGRACEGVVVCDEVSRFLRRLADTDGNRQAHADGQAQKNFSLPPSAFSLVFADPPYEWVARVGWGKTMAALGCGVLAGDGVFVAEQAAEQPAWTGEGWEVLRDRVYGGTRVCVYRKGAET